MPYLTPDAPPDETRCFILTIPNDVTWIGIVKGALSELIKSYNYEAFGAFSPAQTASKFLDIYDQFVTQECDDMACCNQRIERRATDDGRLQISYDGGAWEQDPDDPRISGTSLPPIVMDDTHTKCDAATNGMDEIRDFIAKVSEDLQSGLSAVELAGEIAILICALLFAPESIPILLPLLIAAAAALFNIGQAAWNSYFTSEVEGQILCALYCSLDENGQLTSIDAFVNRLRATMTDGIGKDEFIRFIVAMGKKGVDNMCAKGTSAEADCSDCADCTTCDFSGWEIHAGRGVIVDQPGDGSYITVQAVLESATWFVDIRSPDVDQCCCHIEAIVLDGNGATTETYITPCGSDQSDGSLDFAYVGNESANRWGTGRADAGGGDTGFTIKIHSTGDCA